jgi:hypothetical protein
MKDLVWIKNIFQFVKIRQLITKFRSSDHNLEIEKGRYKNIPCQQRLCNTCNNIEDEDHFFLH